MIDNSFQLSNLTCETINFDLIHKTGPNQYCAQGLNRSKWDPDLCATTFISKYLILNERIKLNYNQITCHSLE